MLNGSSPRYLHVLQNITLLLITIFFLPLSTTILFFSYVTRPSSSSSFDNVFSRRRQNSHGSPSSPPGPKRTILVTGINMNKGLALARAFHEAGHDVIGADFEHYGIPIPGRFSRSLRKFYRLPKPIGNDTSYIDTLLMIIYREKVDLWVSCAGLMTAMEEAQAKETIEQLSDCVAIQFGVATTNILHQKHLFIQRTQDLGLPIPETHHVTSKNAVLKILHDRSPDDSEPKYIMKAVGIEDSFRADMTLLPRPTMTETENHISPFPISDSNPWVLQEYIRGGEYCTHALIVNNIVKTFVACPSSNLLMRYKALHADSSLSLAMRRFTQEFVSRSEPGMTGHLSFDFMIQETASEAGVHLGLRVIECNPRAHTAVVLFANRSHEMTEAYLSALPSPPHQQQRQQQQQHTDSNGLPDPHHHLLQHHHLLSSHPNNNSNTLNGNNQIVTPLETQPPIYWLGHEIITLLFLPLLHRTPFASPSSSPSPSSSSFLWTYLTSCLTLLHRVLFWKDGMYEQWDPLPFWWLYHAYWPGILLACAWTDRRWSRLNVSTGRILEC